MENLIPMSWKMEGSKE